MERTLRIEIPGRPALLLRELLFDYNGTLACDGQLIDGVADRLSALSTRIGLRVLTADTFGSAAHQLASLPVTLEIVPDGAAKLACIKRLGPARVAAIGNGNNDIDMLSVAALGIAVIGAEGACGGAVRTADVVVRDIRDALDLLLEPRRLVATLRA